MLFAVNPEFIVLNNIDEDFGSTRDNVDVRSKDDNTNEREVGSRLIYC